MAVTTNSFTLRTSGMDAFQYDGVNVTQQDVVDWLTANLDMETHFIQPNGNTVLFGQNGTAPWYAWLSSWLVRYEDGSIVVLDHALIQAFYRPQQA